MKFRGDRAVIAQSVLFTGSNLAVSLVAAVSTAVITRNMTTSGYGSFSFVVAAVAFLSLFFEFGLFIPASIRAAQADGESRREILGTALGMYAVVGVAFSGVVFASSFFVDSAFHVHAAGALRLGALLAWTYPFMLLIAQQLIQGADRLHIYSLGALVAQVLVLGFTAGWLVLHGHHGLDVTAAFLLRSGAFAVAAVGMVLWLRPAFRNARAHGRHLMGDARKFGLSMYVGRVLSVGTYNMDVLMLGVFADPRAVGFYTLAGSITALVTTGAGGIASALFPRMARSGKIAARWLIVVFVGGMLATGVLVAFARPFIDLVFSPRYGPAAALVLPLGLAAVVRAVTTIYNSLLSARGQGRELRNAGVALTVSNLALNFLLIPPFKAMGAAWASFGALLVNLLVHVLYAYRPASVVDVPGPTPAPHPAGSAGSIA